MDTAHVPLQRLVLYLGDYGHGRHTRLPEKGGTAEIYRIIEDCLGITHLCAAHRPYLSACLYYAKENQDTALPRHLKS